MFNRRKKIDEYYNDNLDLLMEKVDALEEHLLELQKFIDYFRGKSCEVIGLEKIKDEWILLYKLDNGISLYIMLNKLEKFRPDWDFAILSSVYSDFHYNSEKNLNMYMLGILKVVR